MSGEKILVVEDAPDYRMATEMSLEDEGFHVQSADDGDAALRAFYSYQPDLALLDVGLPGMSGIGVCERIRSMSNIPVIILTAALDIEAKLEAFACGADDYVVKGVDMEELIARVKAALRRAARGSHAEPSEVYADPVLTIDFARQLVRVRGAEVQLTRTEYELLSVLVVNEGQPFRADQLLHRVWGAEYNTEDLVKWHIGKLRRKIELDPDHPELLITRRGFGYVYLCPQPELDYYPRPEARPDLQETPGLLERIAA